jgi:hypothetical protein
MNCRRISLTPITNGVRVAASPASMLVADSVAVCLFGGHTPGLPNGGRLAQDRCGEPARRPLPA